MKTQRVIGLGFFPPTLILTCSALFPANAMAAMALPSGVSCEPHGGNTRVTCHNDSDQGYRVQGDGDCGGGELVPFSLYIEPLGTKSADIPACRNGKQPSSLTFD
jgi:hypothetical protein